MEIKRRTQADRTAATRAALIAAARDLFAEHGFAGVSTDAIVKAADVSRGALYHHFADKTELFAAVVEELERELTAQIAASIDLDADDLLETMVDVMETWLTIGESPGFRVAMLDGPSVLGWERWRDVTRRHLLALIETALSEAMADGTLVSLPSEALANILLAASDEAAMYAAAADDPEGARRDVVAVLRHLLASLVTPPAQP